jgi:hypothetical protein
MSGVRDSWFVVRVSVRLGGGGIVVCGRAEGGGQLRERSWWVCLCGSLGESAEMELEAEAESGNLLLMFFFFSEEGSGKSCTVATIVTMLCNPPTKQTPLPAPEATTADLFQGCRWGL